MTTSPSSTRRDFLMASAGIGLGAAVDYVLGLGIEAVEGHQHGARYVHRFKLRRGADIENTSLVSLKLLGGFGGGDGFGRVHGGRDQFCYCYITI